MSRSNICHQFYPSLIDEQIISSFLSVFIQDHGAYIKHENYSIVS